MIFHLTPGKLEVTRCNPVKNKLEIQSRVLTLQVNPLAEAEGGTMVAADAKLNFDDNAAYRQKDIFAGRDKSQEDPREVRAAEISSIAFRSIFLTVSFLSILPVLVVNVSGPVCVGGE